MNLSLLPLFIACVPVWPISPSAALALDQADKARPVMPAVPSAAREDRDAATFPEGVVIEDVWQGFPGHQAGLRPGDVVDAWSRDLRSLAGAALFEERIRSPFALTELGLEELPRGSLVLRVNRDGEVMFLPVPPEAVGFGVRVRPALPPPILDLYERGRALVTDGDIDEGTSLWREAAAAAGRTNGGAVTACWLLGQVGLERGRLGHHEASRAAYREAVACGEPLGPLPAAALLEDQGLMERDRGQFGAARDAFAAALTIRRNMMPNRLATAACLRALARIDYLRGHSDLAVALYREALSVEEVEAPASMAVAETLRLLGLTLQVKGQSEAAEQAELRAAQIAEAAAPGGATLLGALTNLGGIASQRGDLVATDRLWRRALEGYRTLAPDGLNTIWAQLNLGELAMTRGDLVGAEGLFRRALPLAESTEGGRPVHAALLHGLGHVAREKGHLALAEELFGRAVAEFEELGPHTYPVIEALISLGQVLNLRGDEPGARRLFGRALARCEEATIGGVFVANAVTSLGDLARANGEWRTAEGFYERALAIRERLSPASADLAHVLHGLGAVRRAHGEVKAAESLFSRAIEALEGQRSRLGGSDEARSSFYARFFGMYQDQIELLVDQGRAAEAFGVLERCRARSFLTLMAERDLVLEDEVPPQLERERRRVDAEYERTRTALDQLVAEKDTSEIERLTSRLRELRVKQNEISARIREASPRQADLRDPQPLDAQGVQASLDPGTAFLAYSVGKDETVLFVLTAAGAGVRAITIPLGEAQLRERVNRWRRLAERTVPPAEFFTEGRALYDVLLRPAEPHLQSARRLLVSPDGPLHQLPFAALRRGESYLAEWKPLSLVPSGTFYAQMARSRESVAYATDFEAFGDPHAAGLAPLPATRHEVELIARLFPQAAVHLGQQATEERAKAVGKGVRYVHFASHGLIDEHLPLDSALALSAPAAPGEDRDNGRLHAWEIIERVRLDADLVTLSACRSAVGTELAGEGLIGLTRAFHYAGARSVLASLWSVGDKSTFVLMAGVYRFLKDGLPKDEALRRAQVQAIRRGHHPVRWAAFQLYGDWRSSSSRGVSVRAQREAGTPPSAEPAVALRGAPLPRQPAYRRRK